MGGADLPASLVAQAGRPYPSAWSRWSALVGLTAVTFLLLADDTAVAVALPAIQGQLRLSFESLSWVVNAYTVAIAAFTLLAGRLTDRDGARRIFLVGLAVFILGSLVGGLASTGAVLITARGVQGIGAAFVAPAALALIALTFPPRQRGVALGIWSGVSASALGLGPIFGAVINDALGWPWLFLVNVPLGAAAWLGARLLLPPPAFPGTGGRIDVLGVILSGVALVALVLALGSVEGAGWASPGFLLLLALGVAAAVLFVARERRVREPLVDLTVFRDRAITGANLVSLLSTAVMCSLFFFLALYLQTVAGLSALAAGAALLPMTVSTVVVAPIAGRLTDLLGGRILILGGMLLLAAALLGLGILGIRSGGAPLAIWLALAGIGIGLARTPTTAAALGSGSEYGMAAGILNTSQAAGLSLGIALMGLILTSFGPNAAFDRTFGPEHHAAFLEGLGTGISINAAIAAGAAVLAAVLLPPRARLLDRDPARGTTSRP